MIGKISYMAIPATPKLYHGLDMFIVGACKLGGIEYNDLMAKSRKEKVQRVRHILAYNFVFRHKLSTKKAGKMLGLDHSTIVHSKKKYVEMYKQDLEFRELANKIATQ